MNYVMEESMVTVSIIIPIYRVEKYIERCLDSVRAQTYENYEVILVDDCGGDNSIQLAESYISKHNLIRWKIVSHDKNRGLSAARNTGICEACGQYVYFLDSDDTITENCIELLVNHLVKDVDFVMASYTNIPVQAVFPNFGKGIYTQEELVYKYCKQELPWNAVNRLIRRDFLLKNSLFFHGGIFSEDLLWNFHILAYVNKAVLVDTITYHYYVNQNSIMNSCNYNYKYAEDLLFISQRMYELVQNHFNQPQIHYLHIVKYDIIPRAVLWHHYPFKYKWHMLSKLFQDRFYVYYRFLPIKKRLLLLLPALLLILCYFMFFWGEEYGSIVFRKLRLGKI